VKVLLFDDDHHSSAYLRRGLLQNGFSVATQLSGERTCGVPQGTDFDVLIYRTPLVTSFHAGFAFGAQKPVLFLAGRDQSSATGLPGSADVLEWPSSFSALLNRIDALVRANGNDPHRFLTVADLQLDLLRRRALRGKNRLDLTPKEFLLLSLLMCRAGEVVSRKVLWHQVWDINFDSQTNFLAVHIRRLRAKVDDPYERKLIHTVRGVGYVLEERTAEAPLKWTSPRQSLDWHGEVA
jgi:two-component system copper resistance phosphate regulon response regulator CusR